jgi:hypothetical protein
MNSTDACSSPGLPSAQDFELALETRAESEVDIRSEAEVEDDVENEDDDDDDESESNQPGKFTSCLQFFLTFKVPITALPALPARPTATMNALVGRLSVRNPSLRTDRVLNTTRPSNMEAYLNQLTGLENANPCSHFQKGAGI